MIESPLIEDVTVRPDCLLHVAYEESGARIEIVALTCHYVAAGPNGQRRIGIEIVFDPEIQPPKPIPTEPYRCPMMRLEQRLVSSRKLKKIAPIKIEELLPTPHEAGDTK
jgi:hypothetical protein